MISRVSAPAVCMKSYIIQLYVHPGHDLSYFIETRLTFRVQTSLRKGCRCFTCHKIWFCSRHFEVLHRGMITCARDTPLSHTNKYMYISLVCVLQTLASFLSVPNILHVLKYMGLPEAHVHEIVEQFVSSSVYRF